jgi:hypothetical protein
MVTIAISTPFSRGESLTAAHKSFHQEFQDLNMSAGFGDVDAPSV